MRWKLVLTTALVLTPSPAVQTLAQEPRTGSPTDSVADSPARPAAPPAPAPPVAPRELAAFDAAIDARVGPLVDAFAKKGPFSGVVAVGRAGQVIAARVAGAPDLERPAPMRLDTPFRIASVTKPVTAAGVLALRARKQVDLDAPVSKYLPDAPAAWSKITVRHLLSHRSGLGEFADGPEYDARRHRPATTAELWNAVLAVPPRTAPGLEPDYCNSNYVVLGALVERLTKEPLDTAMRRLVFQPLGMAATAVDSAASPAPDRAIGHRYTGRLEHAAPFDATNAGAAGNLRSTAADLIRFAHALSGPGLLSDDSRKQMFDAPPGSYGLGCFVGELAAGA